MTATWILLALIGCAATLVGLAGCFVPVLPGPAIAYAALWILFAFDCPPSTVQLAVGAGVLVVVTLVDYVLPSMCAKKFKCSRWNGETYELAKLKSFRDADLRKGPMGILEPKNADVVSPKDVAVWLVPGLAFTRDGKRLGYGGGWYDRLMVEADKRALKLGVAYAFQVLENLPSEPHDIGVDSVVAFAHKK